MLASVMLLRAPCQLLSMHACASCCYVWLMALLYCCTAVLQVIITTNYVLVMNPEDENVLPFITELKMKISQPSGLAGVRSAAHCVSTACVRPQDASSSRCRARDTS